MSTLGISLKLMLIWITKFYLICLMAYVHYLKSLLAESLVVDLDNTLQYIIICLLHKSEDTTITMYPYTNLLMGSRKPRRPAHSQKRHWRGHDSFCKSGDETH